MLSPPIVGKALPVHETYRADETARRFWRASFRVGRHYLSGQDANGQAVLVKHEREEDDSFARRLRLCKPRNFVGPIIRRYNDLVFRKPPMRSHDHPLIQDADGAGHTLDDFMRRALLMAQIDRESHIIPDRTGGVETPANAAQASGAQPVLRLVSASDVVNWETDSGGNLLEAWVLWSVDGMNICRVYRRTTMQDYPLKKTGGDPLVESEGPEIPHGYQSVPIVVVRPNLDPLGPMDASSGDSQAGPIAESQAAVANLLSLHREEIFNVTFSQMIAFGASADGIKDAKVGNNRVICIPNPAGSVEMIGADPAQAATILAAILDEVDNLMRLAGVNQGDSQAAQSGAALAFRHNDLATIVASLADAAERAEAGVWRLIVDGWGGTLPARPVYQGKDADLPDFAAETQTMAQIVGNAALPPVVRSAIAKRYARRNLSLDDADMEEMELQIDNASPLARALAQGNPFPVRAAPAQDQQEPGTAAAADE